MWIPGGLFMMGATAFRGNPEERPMHEAAVASFFLDEDEVTLAEYRACVDAGKCKATHRDHRFCNAKLEDRDDHPVNCVDLTMAKAFCEWAGKRLPTEVQSLAGVAVEAVATGSSHTVVQLATGELRAVGCNELGQLGGGAEARGEDEMAGASMGGVAVSPVDVALPVSR